MVRMSRRLNFIDVVSTDNTDWRKLFSQGKATGRSNTVAWRFLTQHKPISFTLRNKSRTQSNLINKRDISVTSITILWKDASFIRVSMVTRIRNVRKNKRFSLEYKKKSSEISCSPMSVFFPSFWVGDLQVYLKLNLAAHLFLSLT